MSGELEEKLEEMPTKLIKNFVHFCRATATHAIQWREKSAIAAIIRKATQPARPIRIRRSNAGWCSARNAVIRTRATRSTAINATNNSRSNRKCASTRKPSTNARNRRLWRVVRRSSLWCNRDSWTSTFASLSTWRRANLICTWVRRTMLWWWSRMRVMGITIYFWTANTHGSLTTIPNCSNPSTLTPIRSSAPRPWCPIIASPKALTTHSRTPDVTRTSPTIAIQWIWTVCLWRMCTRKSSAPTLPCTNATRCCACTVWRIASSWRCRKTYIIWVRLDFS